MSTMEVLLAQGFRVRPVEEQMTPDGQFPNVTQTPNREVPASMDRAAALAQQQQADLVLATDPDADRHGTVIPDRNRSSRLSHANKLTALLMQIKRRAPIGRNNLTTNITTITTQST